MHSVKEDKVIFIIKPDRDIFNLVFEKHLVLKTMRPNLIQNLVFVPKENYDIIEYITTNQLTSSFILDDLNIDLIPIDVDLFSLERENSLKEIYIDNDYSCISELANAVVRLELCFGKIKNKYIKGDLAQLFSKLVEEKEKETNMKFVDDEIFNMIVIDRSIDFITLMTTNYTVEGLIDQNIGIHLGKISVKDSILNENLDMKKAKSKKPANSMATYALTSDVNRIFCQLGCMHYLHALQYLKLLSEHYQGFVDIKKKDKTTEDMLKSVENLQNFLKYCKNDLKRCENLISYVVEPIFEKEYANYISKEQSLLAGKMPENLYQYYDEHLSKQKEIISLIRLMVIESLTQNGIVNYQKLKREILNIYGYQKIFLFRDLEILGWLKEKSKKIKLIKTELTYINIIEKLKLINVDYNPKEINDCSYVLSGFCPISLKLIESAIQGSWGQSIEVISKMSGETSYPEDETVINNPTKEKNLMLIVFVGGITYTEIEAIRYLNRKYNDEYKKGERKKTQFIILTTSILNRKKVFDSLGKDINSIFNMKMFSEQNKEKVK